MTDLDKMARELLKDSERGKASDFMPFAHVVAERDALKAIATALLTAPPGWKLVPTGGATDAMRSAWDSAPDNEDDDIAFHGAYRAMVDAAPEVK